jgi:hypothetical protein
MRLINRVQPKAINRQTDEDNFNLFMGRANNVTQSSQWSHSYRSFYDVIGHCDGALDLHVIGPRVLYAGVTRRGTALILMGRASEM